MSHPKVRYKQGCMFIKHTNLTLAKTVLETKGLIFLASIF